MQRMQRFDERDIMFSRLELTPDTPRYDEYYARHPERKQADDAVRNTPIAGLLGHLWSGYDSNEPLSESDLSILHTLETDDAMIDAFKHTADHAPVATQKFTATPEDITPIIKAAAKHYSAALVATLELADHHYYTHHGRPRGLGYGKPVDTSLRYAVIFAVEMDADPISLAPRAEEMLATIGGYRKAAQVGCSLTLYLKSLGYNAFLNADAHYTAPLTPLAHDAGLGQIGRHNLLITREFGPRIRLGAVMTDLPLLSGAPVDLGLVEFCKQCGRCAKACLGQAISPDDPQLIDGRPRWPLIDTACMTAWRKVGSDCGLCIATCPFTHGQPVPADSREWPLRKWGLARAAGRRPSTCLYPLSKLLSQRPQRPTCPPPAKVGTGTSAALRSQSPFSLPRRHRTDCRGISRFCS